MKNTHSAEGCINKYIKKNTNNENSFLFRLIECPRFLVGCFRAVFISRFSDWDENCSKNISQEKSTRFFFKAMNMRTNSLLFFRLTEHDERCKKSRFSNLNASHFFTSVNTFPTHDMLNPLPV